MLTCLSALAVYLENGRRFRDWYLRATRTILYYPVDRYQDLSWYM